MLPMFDQIGWKCIHFIEADEVDSILEKINDSVFLVRDADFCDVASDKDLFSKLSVALEFPDYFGNNWDALDECLMDMEWLSSEGYIFIVYSSDIFWENSECAGGRLLSAWLNASKQWGKEGVPFHLVFVN